MQFALRPSRVLRKLRNGETVYCTKTNLTDPRVCQIAASCGWDCIWGGMEHMPNDWFVIENQIMAAKCYDVDFLCRVARGSYSDYIRPLELDATGIMVPHVMSAEDARKVVQMTRFQPVGRRALDGGNTDGHFAQIPAVEYIEQANRERFLVLQIEDPEAVEELDDIAAVEGYDMLFFGPGDYSHALGVVGQLNHPKVVEARRQVAEAALKHGKFAATVGSVESVPELLEYGYKFINVSADVVALGRFWQQNAEALGITGSNKPVQSSPY